MTRSNWIALAAALIGLVLAIYFAHGIWAAITWIVIGIADILVFLWDVFAAAMFWFWQLLVAALVAAMPVLIIVTEIVLVGIACALGVGVLAFLSLMLAQTIGNQLKVIGEQLQELRVEFRTESRKTGRDAAFLAVVAALSGLIAYMGTEEFLKHISTIRFMAVGCFGFAAAKIFLFFPSRAPKISGLVLTVILLVGSIVFFFVRYGFTGGFWHGITQMREIATAPENQLKLLLTVILAMFWFLTLLFPFTIREWRELLAAPVLDPDRPSAAKLSQIGAPNEIAQISLQTEQRQPTS